MSVPDGVDNTQTSADTAERNPAGGRFDPRAFVGRQWLVEYAAQFRDDPHRRQLVVVGEPGRGKSAFVAHLARLWDCPRHFIRTDSIGGVIGVDPRSFLISLGEQLYTRYGREIFADIVGPPGSTRVTTGWTRDQGQVIGRLIDELYTLPFLPAAERHVEVLAGVTSGAGQVIGERIGRLVNVAQSLDPLTLLHVTLLEPLRKLQELRPNKRVVILIDALDESAQHAGQRIVDVVPRANDAVFPPNLRLIMTSRPGADYLTRYPDDILDLDDRTSTLWREQQRDIHTYVVARLDDLGIATRSGGDAERHVAAFARRVEERSDGNFLFLYHFMNAVAERATSLTELALDAVPIPAGLDKVYEAFAVEKIRDSRLGTIIFSFGAQSSEAAQQSAVDVLAAHPSVRNVNRSGSLIVLVVADTTQVLNAVGPLLGSTLMLSDIKPAAAADAFEHQFLPVLGVLAIAQEPLSVAEVARFAGVETAYAWLVVSELRQFLDTRSDEDTDRYAVYHSSFAEYLVDPRRNRAYPVDAAAAHQRIVNYYTGQQDIDAIDWRAVLDAYASRRLSTHLSGAGREQDLFALVDSQRWYDAQLAMDPSDGHFVADIASAWQVADRKGAAHIEHTAQAPLLAREVWLALTTASMRSLSRNIPPALLVQLVRAGLWEPDTALTAVRQISESEALARALTTLLPALPERLVHQVMDVAEAVADPAQRASILAAAADHVQESERIQVLASALAALSSAGSLDIQIQLPQLAPNLSEALFAEAIAIVRTLPEELQSQSPRSSTLVDLIAYVPDTLLSTMQAAALELNDDDSRMWVMARLMSRVPESLLDEARAAVVDHPGVASGHNRAQALAALAGRLSRVPRAQLWHTCLDLVGEIDEPFWRAEALADLAPYFGVIDDADVLEAVRRCANQLEDTDARARALSAIAQFLHSDGLVEEALAAADAAENPSVRSQALECLAGRLIESMLDRAQAVAIHTLRGAYRISAVCAVAPLLTQRRQYALLRQAMKEALEGVDEFSSQVGQVADLLPQPLLAEALAAARKLPDAGARASAMVDLVLRMDAPARDAVFPEILATVEQLTDPYSRSNLLAALVEVLPPPLMSAGLEAAFGFDYQPYADQVMSVLAPKLPPSLLTTAVARSRAIDDAALCLGARAALLASAPVAAEDARVRAVLEEARTLASHGSIDALTRVLATLAARLPSEVVSESVSLALRALARADADATESSLRALSMLVDERNFANALAAARNIDSDDARIRALSTLVEFAPDAERSALVHEIFKTPAEHFDADLLLRVVADTAAFMGNDDVDQVLQRVLSSGLADRRAAALSQLARRLSGPQLKIALRKTLAWARRRPHSPGGIGVVMTLVPYLPVQQQKKMVADMRAAAYALPVESARQRLDGRGQPIPQSSPRAQGLIAVAPHLVSAERAQVLADALQACRAYSTGRRKAEMLIDLALAAPEPEIAGYMSEAVAAIRALGPNGASRVRGIQQLIVHVSDALLTEVVAEAVAGGSAWPTARVLAAAGPRMATWPPAALYPLWQRLLHTYAEQDRESLLTNLQHTLMVMLVPLAGEQAVVDTADAVHAVQQRWP